MVGITRPNRDAIQRIHKTVKCVEATPIDPTGHRRKNNAGRSGFWAHIPYDDSTTIKQVGPFGHHWEKVVPNLGGAFWLDPDGVRGTVSAHNINKVAMPLGTIVFLNFVGYVDDDNGEEVPQYVFAWDSYRSLRVLGYTTTGTTSTVGMHLLYITRVQACRKCPGHSSLCHR